MRKKNMTWKEKIEKLWPVFLVKKKNENHSYDVKTCELWKSFMRQNARTFPNNNNNISSDNDTISRMVTNDFKTNNETPSEWFVKELQKIYHELDKIFEKSRAIQHLLAATTCLNQSWNKSVKSDQKVEDHCHFAG